MATSGSTAVGRNGSGTAKIWDPFAFTARILTVIRAVGPTWPPSVNRIHAGLNDSFNDIQTEPRARVSLNVCGKLPGQLEPLRAPITELNVHPIRMFYR